MSIHQNATGVDDYGNLALSAEEMARLKEATGRQASALVALAAYVEQKIR